MFANVLKIKKQITFTWVFRPFTQYFVEAPLAAITAASSLLGYDTTSLVHLYLGSFSHSYLQSLSSSVRLDGERRCTAFFRSLQRCLIEFKSGLWLGHSRTFKDLSRYNSCIVLAVYFESLSCWKVKWALSLRSWALWSRFSLRSALYFASFILILTSLSVPAAERHPHSMMLPPPCFTVGLVPGFLQTGHLAVRPNNSILVSSDQRILFDMVWEYFGCPLANSKRAVMCLFWGLTSFWQTYHKGLIEAVLKR